MNSFWRHCLAHFEKELPPQQFVTWIKPLKVEMEGDVLTLIAPNRFVLQWIRDKFCSRIQELAAERLKRAIDIRLVLAEKETKVDAPVVSIPAAPEVPQPKASRDISRLNSSFTFETFVTGKAGTAAGSRVTFSASRSRISIERLRRSAASSWMRA